MSPVIRSEIGGVNRTSQGEYRDITKVTGNSVERSPASTQSQFSIIIGLPEILVPRTPGKSPQGSYQRTPFTNRMSDCSRIL